MVSGEQRIQWLDTSTNEFHDAIVSALVAKYVHKMFTSRDMAGIDFPDDNTRHVWVPDWKGWTVLKSIRCYLGEPRQLLLVKSEHGKELVGTPDQLIPIYDKTSITRGFHGETKYANTTVKLSELKVGDTIRVLHLEDEMGNLHDFDQVASIEPYPHPEKAYDLTTKSGYLNIGDIYIHDHSVIDECKCGTDGTCQCAGGCKCHGGRDHPIK